MFSAVESTDVNECNEPEDVTEDVKENWDDSEEEAEGAVEMKGEEEEVEVSGCFSYRAQHTCCGSTGSCSG